MDPIKSESLADKRKKAYTSYQININQERLNKPLQPHPKLGQPCQFKTNKLPTYNDII